MTNDSLYELLRSTRALHERFGVPFQVDVAERLCAEEFRELIRASVLCETTGEFWHLSEEAVDLFVVVLGLLQAHNIPNSHLEEAIENVIAKNDAKTHDTHELRDGKITRKMQP